MPNWKKVIVSGSNAVLNNITASGHMSVLSDSFSVFTHTSTELEVVGNISASSDSSVISSHDFSAANNVNVGGSITAEGSIQGSNIVATNNIQANNNLTVANQLQTLTRRLNISSAVIGNANGDVVFFGTGVGGADTVEGSIYRYDGAQWVLADKNNSESGKNLLAVALGSNPATDGMFIRGFVTLANPSGDSGIVLYLGTMGGTINIPTDVSGDVSRVIGYSVDSTNNQIYFNPSMDWIDIT